MSAKLLNDLHQDHKLLDRVLRTLDQQCDILRAEQTPDYGLIEDILSYMADYPDRFHHPVEDEIFKRYLGKGGRAQEDVRHLMQQHDSLIADTREFRKLLESVLMGAPVTREQLCEAMQSYSERQRAHMDMEEGKVFPALDAEMSEADWKALGPEVADYQALKLSEGVAERYQRLRDELV